MAHPRKYSRRVTVGATTYRWRLAIYDDYPWTKSVAVYLDGVKNGAEVRFQTDADSITPGDIRRVVEFALEKGFSFSGETRVLQISRKDAQRIMLSFSRTITTGSGQYCWTPDFHGGLHLKIRSAVTPRGQLLAAGTALPVARLTDAVAAEYVARGLQSGWQPGVEGLDCFWLDGNDAECLPAGAK